jgi:hypothetical protein
MAAWVDLPRMELFFQDGFPFTRMPDSRDMVIFLAEKSLPTVSAGVNLLALSSQKVGYPAFGARFSFEPPKDPNKEILAVGPIARVPPEILKAAPVKVGRDGSISYPQLKKPDSEPPGEDSWARRILSRFLAPPVAERTGTPPWRTFTLQGSGLGSDRAIFSQFESPYQAGRSVFLLGAASSAEVFRGAVMMWEPSAQGRMAGDTSILELSSPDFQAASAELGSKYYLGDRGPASRLTSLLYSHPGLFLALLFAAFIILTYAIYRLLKRQRRRRMGDEGV